MSQDYLSDLRQSGNTTQQMMDAPPDAVFVWCTHNLGYPKDLARSLPRADLKIVSPSWLESLAIYGCKRPIVVDHAAALTSRQSYYLHQLKRSQNAS